jgi:hypothetical protein
MVGFIFGGNTGTSYDELQRRRSVRDALTRQLMGEKPKTALEGVGAILKGIGLGVSRYRDDKQMAEQTQGSVDRYNSAIESAFSPQGAGASSPIAQAIMDGKPISGGGNYRDAIASIESAGSGDYSAIGPTNQKLGRPLGRYQVMEANIAPWSKQALGREVTPDEFLANPQIQDAVLTISSRATLTSTAQRARRRLGSAVPAQSARPGARMCSALPLAATARSS